ncbi:hypothetical protein, partial [Brucella melitensis]|uniref:hypothetical protein n=1 Tax=Brucella melitensis TaxID=29459 RepID=UPI001AEC4ACF
SQETCLERERPRAGCPVGEQFSGLAFLVRRFCCPEFPLKSFGVKNMSSQFSSTSSSPPFKV